MSIRTGEHPLLGQISSPTAQTGDVAGRLPMLVGHSGGLIASTRTDHPTGQIRYVTHF